MRENYKYIIFFKTKRLTLLDGNKVNLLLYMK